MSPRALPSPNKRAAVTGARSTRPLASSLFLALAVCGCGTSVNNAFCDENTPCSDPERPFCDLSGEFGGSGEARTCIPSPFDATPEFVTVSIEIAGSGSGSVESLLGTEVCATGVCELELPNGSEFSLRADADDEMSFVHWSGACSGFEDCTVTVTQATTITATFEPQGDVLWKLRPQRGPDFGVRPFVGPTSLATNSRDEIVVGGGHVGTPNFGGGALISGPAKEGSVEAFVAQYDADSEHLWSHAFSGSGLSDDRVLQLAIDANDTVTIAGEFEEDMNLGGTPLRADLHGLFTAQLDRDGTPLGAFGMPGSTSVALATLNNGELFAGTSPSRFDWFSSSGEILRSLEPSPQNGPSLFAREDSLGRMVVVGVFGQAMDFAPNAPVGLLTPLDLSTYLVRLNADASFDSGRVIDATFPICMANAPDGSGIYVVGTSVESFDLGDGNTNLVGDSMGFVAKYNDDLSLAWKVLHTSSSAAGATACTVDVRGNLVVAGGYVADVQVAENASVHSGEAGNYLVKYRGTTGALVWSNFADGADSSVVALASDSVGRISAAVQMGTEALTIDGETVPGETGQNLLLMQFAP